MTTDRSDEVETLLARSAAHLAKGSVEEAEQDARAATALAPTSGDAHNALANILIKRGETDEAERAYRRAISLDPALPKPHHNLGNILRARSDLEAAANEYRRAIELNPSAYRSFAALAGVLVRLEKPQEAETAYRAALAFGDTKALCLGLAMLLGDSKKFDEVPRLFERARGLGASGFALEMGLAEALATLGETENAGKAFVAARKALENEVNSTATATSTATSTATPTATSNSNSAQPISALRLANVAFDLRRYGEAVEILEALVDARASIRTRERSEALDLFWRAKLRARDIEGAWAAFERALGEGNCEMTLAGVDLFAAIDDHSDLLERVTATLRRASVGSRNREEAQFFLATRLLRLGRPCEAQRLLLELRGRHPRSGTVTSLLGETMLQLGEPDEALRHQREALALDPDNAATHARLLLVMHYSDEPTREEIFAEHVRFGKKLDSLATEVPRRASRSRLRIGLLSGDFARHSVCRLLLPWMIHHDRTRFELHAYMTDRQHDYYTDQVISNVHGFHRVHDDSDAALLDRLRKDDLDILIDLSGHTRKGLAVLAHRAAPVQATYLGYPDTTGISAIDYRVTDSLADPEGAEAFAVEELMRLPRTAWCFAPGQVPSTRARGPNDPVVFGSFNNLAKVTPRVVATWARILRRAPKSRLLLKSANFYEEDARRVWSERFEREGIDSNRLILTPFILADGDHIALYGEMDIALDPFPYNGTMTTCEALAMGVPVISLIGERHASRVGLSLLESVGLRDLATPSVEAYEALAVDLALDAERRTTLRKNLKTHCAETELSDAVGFTRAFGAALEQMHERGPKKRALSR